MLERIALLAIAAPRRVIAVAVLIMAGVGIFGIGVTGSLAWQGSGLKKATPVNEGRLSEPEVKQMLDGSDQWELAIQVPDKAYVDVLYRSELSTAAQSTDDDVASVTAPQANPQDTELLEWGKNELPQNKTEERVKNVLALPVTNVTLAGLAITGWGITAAAEKGIARVPWAVGGAFALVIALAISVVGQAGAQAAHHQPQPY